MNAITTGKRNIRKLNISNSIIAAAKEVFLEKGYRLSSMNEIAKRAHITKRTLYKHFTSKLALFIHMFDQHLRKLEKLLSTDVEPGASSAIMLKRIYRSLFNFTLRNEKFMRMYWMLDSNEFDGDMPDELVGTVSKITNKMFEYTKVLTERALAEGLIVGVKPELLSHLISAINKGIFVHANKEKRFEIAKIDPEKMFNTLVMILENGLFVKPVGKEYKK